MNKIQNLILGFLGFLGCLIVGVAVSGIGCNNDRHGPNVSKPAIGNAYADSGKDPIRNFSPYLADSAYAVAKKACVDAIKEQLPTESLKKMVTIYDAQGAPQQVEAPIPTVPEGTLKVVKVILADSEGVTYTLDVNHQETKSSNGGEK